MTYRPGIIQDFDHHRVARRAFKEALPCMSTFCCSHNSELLRGCPHGSRAIFWPHCLAAQVYVINTVSNRICALHIYFDNIDLLLVSK